MQLTPTFVPSGTTVDQRGSAAPAILGVEDFRPPAVQWGRLTSLLTVWTSDAPR